MTRPPAVNGHAATIEEPRPSGAGERVSPAKSPSASLPGREDAGWAVIAVAGAAILGGALAAHGVAAHKWTLCPLFAVLEALWAVALVAQVRHARRGKGGRPPWKTLVVASFAAVFAHQTAAMWLTTPMLVTSVRIYPATLYREIEGSSLHIQNNGHTAPRFTAAVEQTVDAARDSVHFWLSNFAEGIVYGAVAVSACLAFLAIVDVVRFRTHRFSSETGEKLSPSGRLNAYFHHPDSLLAAATQRIRAACAGLGGFLLPMKTASGGV